MKVMIVNQHISRVLGGSELQCDLLARGLAARGHDVVYAAPSVRNADFAPAPYRITSFNPKRSGEFAWLTALEKPDIIYWRYNKHRLLAAVRTARSLQIPFVFTVAHVNDIRRVPDYIQKKPGWWKAIRTPVAEAFKSALNGLAFSGIDGVITLNENFLAQVKNRNKIMIRNGCDPTVEPFVWPRPYCLWVASIKPAKRPELYVELARRMAAEQPEVDFLMAGEVLFRDYRAMLDDAAALPNFHYLGPKTPHQVNGMLKHAHALIHTCRPEGFPNNFIQAWMQGCPTVTYEYDPDGIIAREDLGFVSGDMESIVADTRRLIADAPLRERKGMAARRFAEAHFTFNRMVAQTEDFLEETLRRYPAR